MEHNIVYSCDSCGHSIEIPENMHAGDCRQCNKGTYRQTGESYDQEWIDEQEYNQQQDREYEERHRYDRD